MNLLTDAAIILCLPFVKIALALEEPKNVFKQFLYL